MNKPPRLQSSEYMHWVKLQHGIQYNLGVSGVPDYPLQDIPFSQADLALTGAGSYGFPPLLQAIATRYNVSPESVVTTLGGSMANFLAMALFLEPGDEVLIEQPAYDLFPSIAGFLGASIKRFQRRFEDGFQININELERVITPKTKLIVLTNLHNPTSVYTDEDTMQQIGNLARSVGARVLVGEVYLPTIFDSKPFTTLNLGNEFITTNSLTKAYGLSGLRLGWILTKPDIAQRIWRLIDLFYANHVTLSERLGLRAFEHIDTLTSRSQNLLNQNRPVLIKFLDERTDIECVRTEYGTTVFPRLKNGNVDSLTELLSNKYQTLITPGRFFGMPEHFRIGLSCTHDVFAEGLKRLGMTMDRLK